MGIKSQGHPTSKYNAVWQNTAKGAVSPSPVPSGFSATGGTTATYTDSGINYKSHTFTSPGNFVVSNVGEGTVDYLVVGGGGAGGAGVYANSNAGGGGAGGLLTGTSFSISAQSYPITVGSGGAQNPTGSNAGSPSVFSTITAQGGGGGGYNKNATGSPNVHNGGSGGGATSHHPAPTAPIGWGYGNRQVNSSTPVPSQGNNGGTGVPDQPPSSPSWGSGGGGGAGGVGQNATSSVSGAGGIGVNNGYRYGPPTSDHPTAGDIGYAGGGGGTTSGSSGANPPTAGVPFGGGIGTYNANGSPGVDGKGGGGGGASGYPGSHDGGKGGDGIVVIRYAI